jgi:RHS repeat-associated protein
VGLASTTGTVPTSYTYEPYGKTTVSGTSSASFFGFTGRENDSTGTLSLYNYRARAYSPTLQRFLTEDPLGLAGGDVNLYSYIANGPTYGTDPSGMFLPSDSYGNGSTAPLGSRKDMNPGPEMEQPSTTPQPSSGSSGVECVVAAGFGGQVIAAGGELLGASLAADVIGVSLVAGLLGAFTGIAIIGIATYAIIEGCT